MDGCAEFPILTVTRRNLTAALPALERFLDLPAGSLTGPNGGRGRKGKGAKGVGGGGGRGEALDALVRWCSCTRLAPWLKALAVSSY